MNKEELLQYLKENLSIELEKKQDYDNTSLLKVKLLLEGEEISISTEYITEG